MNLNALNVNEPENLIKGLECRFSACRTVEEACMLMCNELYATCTSAQAGGRTLALSRIFLSLPFQALDPGSQAFAKEKFGLDPLPADMFLTLMGTKGDLPDWCDRKLSNGHRAIPLNRHTVTKVPMLSRCFQQIGFDLEVVLKPEKGLHLEGVSQSFGLFHVEEALGSPFVPTQEEFVAPQHIASVLGSGTMLPDGAVSIWIGFCHDRIDGKSALSLIPMMPTFWHLIQSIYRRRAFFVH